MTSGSHAAATRTLPWRQALPALVLVLAALLAAYRDTVAAMVSIWSRSDTFAHAFLVVPIVLWLVWRQRHQLAAMQPQPSPWMLVPMAAMAFAWMLGDLASVNSVTQLTMTALLVLSVPAVLGLHVARAITFPLAFLFFAVPIGEFLLPQLMSWTADFTVYALQATGIPVYREGNQFAIPSGNWSVVEACSGVRYLIASFMVGTLFAYLNYRSARRRWIFAAISLAVPIVANWVRAYLIVLLGHLSGNRVAVGADHLIYGWLFFGVVVGLMYAIGSLWAEPAPQNAASAAARAPTSGDTRAYPRPEGVWAVAAAVVLLGILPHLALLKIGNIDDASPPQLTRLTDVAGDWQASNSSTSAWQPAFQNPSAQLTSTFASHGREVGVYIGYYRAQSYTRKLVSSDNELVKTINPEWVQTSAPGRRTIQTRTQTLTVRTALLRPAPSSRNPEQRLVVWHLYWVGDRLTTSDQWAKAYGAIDRLLGRGDDSAVIVLYAIDELPNRATASLESFAQANFDAIVAQLRQSRDGSRASVATNLSQTPREQ